MSTADVIVVAETMTANGIKDVEKAQQNGDNDKSAPDKIEANLKGDRLNVALLILLCSLQGIPMGISMAVRTYIQNTKVSYVQQAEFSVVDLPYSLKLLWAPLVDAAYSRRIGKRKTWLIPVQLFTGLVLMYVGSNINHWLTEGNPQMTVLTCAFFCVSILSATQDIAVDGWALTMLRRENVGYASTCNTSGQALGIAFGYVFFILFESETFCNKWLRFTPKEGGIITMEGYLYFWGVMYIVVTLCIALFKRERCEQADKNSQINVMQTYKLLWKIVNLQTIKKFTVIMLAYEVAFSSMGSTVSNPKFMEYGVGKEDIALIDMSMIPIKIIIPIFIAKYSSGPKPMKIFYKTVPYRLVLGISSAVLVYYTPFFVDDDTINGSTYFFLIYEVHRVSRLVLSVVMYLGVQSFFSRISDPRMGGTYMSLLYTVWYLGMALAKIAALGLLNSLTFRRCTSDETNTCQSKTMIKDCEHHGGGKCITVVDGYFIEVGICTLSGIVWYMVMSKVLKDLQSKPLTDWQVDDVNRSEALVDNETCNLPDLVGGNGKPAKSRNVL